MEAGPVTQEIQNNIIEAARHIKSARYLTAFTGAGISTESGVPPFRGEGGLWSKYDPRMFELGYFRKHPEKVWPVLKEIFYEHFASAKPNEAHYVLARLEASGRLKALITQNIDNLHYLAGSSEIVEYHGNSRRLICSSCGKIYQADARILEEPVPKCECGGLLKPDFIFFGEGISPGTVIQSQQIVRETDVMIVVGSTGEIYPAAAVPQEAAANGAKIIEVNPSPSNFTYGTTDIFIRMNAAGALPLIEKEIEQS